MALRSVYSYGDMGTFKRDQNLREEIAKLMVDLNKLPIDDENSPQATELAAEIYKKFLKISQKKDNDQRNYLQLQIRELNTHIISTLDLNTKNELINLRVKQILEIANSIKKKSYEDLKLLAETMLSAGKYFYDKDLKIEDNRWHAEENYQHAKNFYEKIEEDKHKQTKDYLLLKAKILCGLEFLSIRSAANNPMPSDELINFIRSLLENKNLTLADDEQDKCKRQLVNLLNYKAENLQKKDSDQATKNTQEAFQIFLSIKERAASDIANIEKFMESCTFGLNLEKLMNLYKESLQDKTETSNTSSEKFINLYKELIKEKVFSNQILAANIKITKVILQETRESSKNLEKNLKRKINDLKNSNELKNKKIKSLESKFEELEKKFYALEKTQNDFREHSRRI